MRLSIRRIIKFSVIILGIVFVGIAVIDDGSLFTNHTFKNLTKSREEWKRKHALSVQVTYADNGSEKLLFRSQRSAKSVDNSNLDIEASNARDSRALYRATELDDVFISVKTSGKYHVTRMEILLKTWINRVKNQTYIFTDQEEEDVLSRALPVGHVINTNCNEDHGRKSLNCKMAQEFDMFITKGKRWFCHVDDDTYLNTVKLLEMLHNYNHTDDWYLGRPSLGHPIEVVDRSHPMQKLAFWFATGGAGFCISRALALKMIPYAGGGRLMRAGDHIRLPDDCTIGYIINSILRIDLTVIKEFHSHLEALQHIRLQDIKKQITFSYNLKQGKKNVVHIDGVSEEKDPTRFLSIHCYLNPLTKPCLDLR